jgi:poly-gamma-glutamate capsule biosynthesis protein CapA/YwtB (metallophosphatase superfamily)
MGRVLLAAVGDVLVDRPDPDAALAGIRPILDAADVVFGNFEGVLTDVHTVIPGASHASVVPSSNASPLAVFDVMSLANNHSMDAGRGGLADTMAALAGQDVRTAGAGPRLVDALAPVIVERNGLRIAFLAVSAVLQHGAEARYGVPGVAPLRAEDAYFPVHAGISCPGVAPRVVSILNETDWEQLAVAIARAGQDADVVVVSAHWGDHTQPWVLTDHERLCAELIINGGAHLVLGHHQHMLRAVEFLDGKPVFYGLGHIVFDYPRLTEELASYGFDVAGHTADQLAVAFGEYGIYPRPEHPAFPFHPLARRTGVAVVEIDESGVTMCGTVPCVIDEAGIARPLRRDHESWLPMLRFLRECHTRAQVAGTVEDSGRDVGGYPLLEFRGASPEESVE